MYVCLSVTLSPRPFLYWYSLISWSIQGIDFRDRWYGWTTIVKTMRIGEIKISQKFEEILETMIDWLMGRHYLLYAVIVVVINCCYKSCNYIHQSLNLEKAGGRIPCHVERLILRRVFCVAWGGRLRGNPSQGMHLQRSGHRDRNMACCWRWCGLIRKEEKSVTLKCPTRTKCPCGTDGRISETELQECPVFCRPNQPGHCTGEVRYGAKVKWLFT